MCVGSTKGLECETLEPPWSRVVVAVLGPGNVEALRHRLCERKVPGLWNHGIRGPRKGKWADLESWFLQASGHPVAGQFPRKDAGDGWDAGKNHPACAGKRITLSSQPGTGEEITAGTLFDHRGPAVHMPWQQQLLPDCKNQ